MEKNETYSGIDLFRLIAAMLIVAIHTSPLENLGDMPDFVLTNIVARVAVPFFFMTSGFFLISKYSKNTEKLWKFVKKTGILYGVMILICLPLNIYNGYLKKEYLLPSILKDIIFDGTLYHLWYLPASITGAIIAYYLLRKYSYRKTFVITLLLYAIGLFGDSYYGISKEIAFLDSFYNLLFQVMDYTRGGIFFAPIFFIMGGYLKDKKSVYDMDGLPKKSGLTFKKCLQGVVVNLIFMTAEALILHHFKLQRHSSMYVFLPPLMYFCFSMLLYGRKKRYRFLRTASMIIYCMHPLFIVCVRFFAKKVHQERLLVENKAVHYVVFFFISLFFSLGFVCIFEKIKKKAVNFHIGKNNLPTDTDRAYAEVDLDSLRHNIMTIKSILPKKCELMAVVKANAYGHGMYEIATTSERMGVKAFATATIEEGIRLRKYGISGEILILGYTPVHRICELKKYDLTQTLTDFDYAKQLNDTKVRIKVHIKVDTGMHRLGFDADDCDSVKQAFSMKNLRITGIFTHLCAADSLKNEDVEFSDGQIQKFYSLISGLKNENISIPKVHIQSSYGVLNYPELECDYARCGLLLYGVLSSPEDKTRLKPDLRPVLSLRAKVVLVRRIKKGEFVGYNRTFVADRDSKIAILSIGYGDGYPRNLSGGKHYVLINGQKAYIAGRICMDQMAVDVTDIEGVHPGCTATLIGTDNGLTINAPVTAECSDGITNELLSRMGDRLRIVCR